jgi:hypothetical protein
MGSYLFRQNKSLYIEENKSLYIEENKIHTNQIYPPNHLENYNISNKNKNFITRFYEYLVCKQENVDTTNNQNIIYQTSITYTKPILKNHYTIDHIPSSYNTDDYFDNDSVNSEPIILYSETDSIDNFYSTSFENDNNVTTIILNNDEFK